MVQGSVRTAFFRWREGIHKKHHPHAYYDAATILPDSSIETIAAFSPMNTLDRDKISLPASEWYWWKGHGTALFDHLSELPIPPFQPKPKKRKAPVSEPSWRRAGRDGGRTTYFRAGGRSKR